ncbi:hypothetical protein N9Y42_06755 [Mariniblastus sp.]|nr:hypothetical protein [Mariniblastus sp.]
MLRTLLVPAILIGIIATPFLLPDRNPARVSSVSQLPTSQPLPNNYGYPQPVQASTVQQPSPFRQASQQRIIQGQANQRSLPNQTTLPSVTSLPVAASSARSIVPAQQIAYPTQPTIPTQPVLVGQPSYTGHQAFTGHPAIAGQPAGYSDWGGPIYDENNNVIGMVPSNGPGGGFDPAMMGMTPDYGAMQTVTLGGNATGPDFASPMQFTPVMNFAEIFNYGMTSASIGQRWDRVSNVPAADGLRGKRVALVTGTNSWDLHGSLTYYFDEYQKCRRITFRGWAGDPSRLVEYLKTQHGLKQQPTHWAGFYLAKSWRKSISGMLMKSPTVTYTDNKVQQIGVLLELNDPKSKNALSDDFVSLIRGSQQSN